MSGMTKKAKKTGKSTESPSKKPSPSSKTRTAPFRKTALKNTVKQGSGSSGKVTKEENSSSYSVKELTQMKKEALLAKKKSSASFQQESLPQKKKDVWEGYDDEKLPEMTDEQLASFKPVSKEQHQRFKKMVAGGKKMGRPPKPQEEKERVHAIRFSDHLLDGLKAKAQKAGLRWQTYAKLILAAEINKKDKSDSVS